MKYIDGLCRSQIVLFPDMLDDLVSDENPVRVVDAFVDQLDLPGQGFSKSELDKTAPGAPCYSPECLLKLYVFGYFKKVRSSRRLMELCRTNIEAMWLLGRLAPDFRTIADFRKDNKIAIKKVFKAFVSICAELDLYNREEGVLDGSKARAANSKDNNVTESKLRKKMEKAEEKINRYLEEMDKNDKEERDAPEYTKEEIEEKIAKLRERKDQYNEMIREMKESGETQMSFTDPESRLMKMANGGFDVAYNIQTVVDPASHIVGVVEVTDNCNDMGLLYTMAEKAKEDLGVETFEITADKGYEDKAGMLECLMNGIMPHVPAKAGEESYELEAEYKEAEITEAQLDSTKPEDIRACLEAGLVPNAYKDKGVEVSVREVEQYAPDGGAQLSFALSEDGETVICPNGSALNKASRLHGKGKTRYANRGACRKCKKKCTASKFKQVDLADGQTVLHTREYQKVMKVIIKLTPDKGKIRNRKCVVEHPFGTIKRWSDGSYTLLKGKEKVAADMSLLFLGYNIKRAISLVGTRKLIEKMRMMMEMKGVKAGSFS